MKLSASAGSPQTFWPRALAPGPRRGLCTPMIGSRRHTSPLNFIVSPMHVIWRSATATARSWRQHVRDGRGPRNVLECAVAHYWLFQRRDLLIDLLIYVIRMLLKYYLLTVLTCSCYLAANYGRAPVLCQSVPTSLRQMRPSTILIVSGRKANAQNVSPPSRCVVNVRSTA